MDEGTFNEIFAECWVCGKERGGADGPQDCGWCLQWHCPDCPCPGLAAWEAEHGEGLERGEVRDDCGAYMSLDDIPRFTCKRMLLNLRGQAQLAKAGMLGKLTYRAAVTIKRY